MTTPGEIKKQILNLGRREAGVIRQEMDDAIGDESAVGPVFCRLVSMGGGRSSLKIAKPVAAQRSPLTPPPPSGER